jgi:hypothetical protein
MLFLLLLASAGAGVWILSNPARDPVVVLMDTTADRGVYDEENRGKGVTNAEELKRVLRDLP